MKATSLLEREHRWIDELFDELDGLPPRSPEHRALLRQLRVELDRHTRSEEECLYADLVRVPEARNPVREALAEHQLLRDLCRAIARGDPGAPDYCERIAVLRENVRCHAQDAESGLFQLARRHLRAERLQRLAELIAQRRRRG